MPPCCTSWPEYASNCSDLATRIRPTTRRPAREDHLAPRRRPRQARAQATTGAILEAAARVLSARGYAGTTTNHVAAEAGVSIGSLYEYYPSKDALVVAILEAHIAEATSVLEGAAATIAARPDATLDWIIGTYVAAMVRLHASDPGLHRVLFEEAPLPARVRKTLATVEAEMVAHTTALLRGHRAVRVADPALAAALVVRTVEALTHHHVLLHPTKAVDDQRWAREVTTLVVRYLQG